MWSIGLFTLAVILMVELSPSDPYVYLTFGALKSDKTVIVFTTAPPALMVKNSSPSDMFTSKAGVPI